MNETLRDAQRSLTRDRLVASARTAFEAHGYIGATVDDIVAGAGASRATFYVHFASKLDVFRELSDGLVAEAAAYYDRLDGTLSAGSTAALRRWMDTAVAWFERYRALLPALEEAYLFEPGSWRTDLFDVYAAAMPRYLARWPAARHDEARLRLALLITQLGAFFRWDSAIRAAMPRDVVVDLFSEIWSKALRPPRRDAG